MKPLIEKDLKLKLNGAKVHLTRENKMTTQNFLVEIGTEELPPKALKTLATSFADNVEAELNQAGLSFDKIEWLRRRVVWR